MNKIKFNNKLLTLIITALMVVAVVLGLCIPKNTFSKASADTTAPTPLHIYSSKDYNLHINLGFNKDFTAPSADKVFAKIKISSTCTLTLSGTDLIQLTGFENVASSFGIRYCLSSCSVPFSKNVLVYFTASTINSPIPIRGNETDFKANVKLDILNNFAFETLEIYDKNVAEMFVLTEKPKSTITLKDGANSLGTLSVATNIKLDTVDFSTIVTKKDGFIFKGWSLTADGAVITDLATITIDKDTTLYAVYDKASGNILDDIGDWFNGVASKASGWLGTATGISVSATGIIVVAVFILVICSVKKRR